MRYLVTTKDNAPFLTKYFDDENHFNNEVGMVVYDLIKNIYTDDGITWKHLEVDHL